jgi:hypothetical protein
MESLLQSNNKQQATTTKKSRATKKKLRKNLVQSKTESKLKTFQRPTFRKSGSAISKPPVKKYAFSKADFSRIA